MVVLCGAFDQCRQKENFDRIIFHLTTMDASRAFEVQSSDIWFSEA